MLTVTVMPATNFFETYLSKYRPEPDALHVPSGISLSVFG